MKAPQMKAHRMKPLIFALLLVIVNASCSRETAVPESEIESSSTAATDSKAFFTDDSFAPATIQILDGSTLQPIHGAKVRVLCLGGTPHQDSKDVSDENGMATVTYWDNELLGVSIEKEGYVSASTFINRSNPVFRLKLDQ
jgi:hypothetical protein